MEGEKFWDYSFALLASVPHHHTSALIPPALSCAGNGFPQLLPKCFPLWCPTWAGPWWNTFIEVAGQITPLLKPPKFCSLFGHKSLAWKHFLQTCDYDSGAGKPCILWAGFKKYNSSNKWDWIYCLRPCFFPTLLSSPALKDELRNAQSSAFKKIFWLWLRQSNFFSQ